jgi:hypothetical protein
MSNSMVLLPKVPMKRRYFDERVGWFARGQTDYGLMDQRSKTVRYLDRWRLEVKDEDIEKFKRGELVVPKKQIIYYVDRATPKEWVPYIKQGINDWQVAFEAAGFKDAIIAKDPPSKEEDPDWSPEDVRYSVVRYLASPIPNANGPHVSDPRSGEILESDINWYHNVMTLLHNWYFIQTAAINEDARGNNFKTEVMGRLIQFVSSHEVGHTLGIFHNFAASVNGRESVMDYPHPKVDIKNGFLDLSDAYDVGIGDWDKVTIEFGYQDFANGINEKEALNKILEEAHLDGLKYISDSDARPQGGAHPYAHLWEYGTDPATQLSHILQVRKIALDNFGEANIRTGTSMSELEDVLVPIYLFHRYQVEATVKMIGGLNYYYKLKGDNQPNMEIVNATTQRKALQEMIKAIDPKVLAIPENLLDLIPTRPAGISSSRELFSGNTGPSLDALGIAQTAADLPISLILHPQRANRLVEYGARDNNLSLNEVINTLLENSWKKKSSRGYLGSIQNVVNFVVTKNMIELHASNQANPMTKAIVGAKLVELKEMLSEDDSPYALQAVMMIQSYLDDPSEFEVPRTQSAPPGSPIGSGPMFYCEF